MYWLVLVYLFYIVGEFCIFLVVFFYIMKLVLFKYVLLMMGVYFVMIGFGNKLVGLFGEVLESLGEYIIFIGIVVFCVGFGLLVMLFRKKLEYLIYGVEDNEWEMLEIEGYEIVDKDIN